MSLAALSRAGGLVGRSVARTAVSRAAFKPLALSSVRFASHYDLNLGFPGSRMKNPDPKNYNDVYPDMGYAWWGLIISATLSFIVGSYYDVARPVAVSIGLFGPNMPL
mmetsp:Transcript_93836/g.195750  ORF Transcript_93836/g.195750 Transcript_93836/m.195750 type:complete len:108 (+) Transcript_93836:82-405(+)